MSAVNGGEMEAPQGHGVRAPHLHPHRRGREGNEQTDSRRVVWLAYSWDMATARLARLAPGSDDMGPVRVSGWSSRVVDGRVIATSHADAELWGRAWRIDESVIAMLAHRRHPQGVLEFVVAIDRFDRPLDVRMLALGGPATSNSRTTLLEAGWALRGAAEAELPLRLRRQLRAAPFRRRFSDEQGSTS